MQWPVKEIYNITYENVLAARRTVCFLSLTPSQWGLDWWPLDGRSFSWSATTMSEKLVEHCQELVRVLQNDVSKMCDNMLLESVLSIFPSLHSSLIFLITAKSETHKSAPSITKV